MGITCSVKWERIGPLTSRPWFRIPRRPRQFAVVFLRIKAWPCGCRYCNAPAVSRTGSEGDQSEGESRRQGATGVFAR